MKHGRIAYALAQRVPELEAAQEPRESPQTVAEDAGGAEQPPPNTDDAQEGSGRPWWRRLLWG